MVVGHGCEFYRSGIYSKLEVYNIKVQGWSTMFWDIKVVFQNELSWELIFKDEVSSIYLFANHEYLRLWGLDNFTQLFKKKYVNEFNPFSKKIIIWDMAFNLIVSRWSHVIFFKIES